MGEATGASMCTAALFVIQGKLNYLGNTTQEETVKEHIRITQLFINVVKLQVPTQQKVLDLM